MRFLLSTIGTSMLTNSVQPSNPGESAWYGLLRDTANTPEEELTGETQAILTTLKHRASDVLMGADVQDHRRVSADINGIYALYNGRLPRQSRDVHCLVCTDTAQGRLTGKVVEAFLREQGFEQVLVWIPPGLSTLDTKHFADGIKTLIEWCDEQLQGYRERQYKVTFNLVGSFKSLQGYMNTIGMFYADEIIYIFESPAAELIRIPRLPLQIDTQRIEPYRTKLAMLAAGHLYEPADVGGIPEEMLEQVNMTGNDYLVELSAWGRLVWQQSKMELLAQGDLLALPWLTYTGQFQTDMKAEREPKRRIQLQETLAKVASLLEEGQGRINKLVADHGLQYGKFRERPGMDKFRVNDERRIMCSAGTEGLILHRYGHKNRIY